MADKRAKVLGDRLNGQTITLPAPIESEFQAVLTAAAAEGWTRRMWAKDASLWAGGDADKWLGWLAAARGEAVDAAALEAFGAAVKAGGYSHALLLGMGGSSLGPEVLSKTFGAASGYPQLLVLDSTDPDQIARVEAIIDPASTLFIVSSKSGTTLEPDILHRYFFEVAKKAVGLERAGSRFVAVTDPGSKLEATAKADGFAHIFLGDTTIGGRYSVLSNFGMVPAAVIGLDPRAAFEAAAPMVRACGASAPPAANPGFRLGAALGAAGKGGRDKVTLIASDGVADLGAWLEQLIAESTGKHGKGLIPVDAEPLGPIKDYGADRLFVHLRLEGEDDPAVETVVGALEADGHPVVRIALASRASLFQEFLRWEVATAVAGAVIGIDPFDQPDVEASKIKTRALTDAYEQTGHLAVQPSRLQEDGLTLHADPANTEALAGLAGAETLEAWLGAHLGRAGEGDYVALLAYIDRDAGHIAALQALRARIRDRRKVATVLGFGPRFLHSTGQAYKGGPNSGVFLQITALPRASTSTCPAASSPSA